MKLTKQEKAIDGRMKHFFNQTQALLKLPEVHPEWKKWLSGPNAWITYTISQFNEKEGQIASNLAIRGGKVHLDYIYSLICELHDNPNFEGKTMKQMYEEFGPLEISGE